MANSSNGQMVSQVLILGPLLFLIYINALSNNLSFNPNLFTDDNSRSAVVQKMINWAFQFSNGKRVSNLTLTNKHEKLIFLINFRSQIILLSRLIVPAPPSL